MFIVKGSSWKVVGIENDIVFAEPIASIDSAIPAWEGELIPVSFEVAQKVGELRREIAERLKVSAEHAIEFVLKEYPVDYEAAKRMVEIIAKHIKSHPLPDDKTIVFESHSDKVIVHCCFGSKANETLGKFIAAILAAKHGESIAVRSDAYRIIVTGAELKDIRDVFFNFKPQDIEPILRLSLPRTNLFKYRFLQVAKRFCIVKKGARYEKMNINKLVEAFEGTPVIEEVFREIFHDKLDVELSEKLFGMIQKGEFKIVETAGLSVLGREGLKNESLDITKPEKAEAQIFAAFKKRLLDTRVRLLCVNCGKFAIIYRVKDVPENPICRICGSRLLAVVKPDDSEALKIVKKWLQGKSLTDIEAKKLEKIRQSADLVIVYGKKACIVLAGRGVGPRTATRILAKMHADEESLLKDIYKAEKQFLKPRRFWE
jgi:ATP-dependent Lhr-like helicase